MYSPATDQEEIPRCSRVSGGRAAAYKEEGGRENRAQGCRNQKLCVSDKHAGPTYRFYVWRSPVGPITIPGLGLEIVETVRVQSVGVLS
jgi:hypothetical protein